MAQHHQRRCRVEIVHRPAGQQGFVVLKGRWVVERTFGRLNRSRRLSKDYEGTVESSRAMVLWAMTHQMLKRLHPGSLNTGSETTLFTNLAL